MARSASIVCGRVSAAGPPRTRPLWAGALLVLCLLACGYAAFSGEPIDVSDVSRLQVLVALLGLITALAVCAGAIPLPRSAAAFAAIALIALLAGWSALSIEWSLMPDASWLAANRVAAYACFAAVVLVAAGALPGAQPKVAVGLTCLLAAVAAYALLGKLLPGVEVGPVDLDAGGRFARLREPIGYWNALALAAVMGTPTCIWLAASRDRPPRQRTAAAVVLTLLVLTAALSYSRGAILVYALVVAIMVGSGPRRLPRLTAAAGAVVAIGPALVLAFTRNDLSGSDVPLDDRIDGGLLLGAVVVLCLASVALVARELIRLEGTVAWTQRRSRLVWRGLAAALVLAFVAALAGLSATDRGISGEVSDRVDAFTEPGETLSNTPERLISAHGSSRYVWWSEALGAWWDEPMEGQGAGAFPTIHHLYRRFDAPTLSAHSLPLSLASETGAVGLVLGLGGIGLLLVAGIRRLRDSRADERSARLALLAAGAAWFTHSLYDWHWEIPAVTLPALAAIVVATAPPARGSRPGRGTPVRLILGAVLAVVGAAGLAASALVPALSEQARIDSLALAGTGPAGLENAAEEAERARRLNPLSIEPLLAGASIATARGRQREALDLVEQAARVQPQSWEAQRRLALDYAAVGLRSRAARVWTAWAAADPYNFRALRDRLRGDLFILEHPPGASPTAAGTPPDG